jgi:hypothetical protein
VYAGAKEMQEEWETLVEGQDVRRFEEPRLEDEHALCFEACILDEGVAIVLGLPKGVQRSLWGNVGRADGVSSERMSLLMEESER